MNVSRFVWVTLMVSVLCFSVAGPAAAQNDTQPAEDKQEIGTLWDNFLVFTAVAVFCVGAIGMASKSMAISSMAAYMTFALIAIKSGHSMLESVLYVTLVLVFVGFAFKMWRLEGGGE